ncbi:MAG: macro domain-containing protein [Candidatus Rokubacteria bacterium]|nr:macro domain-containing protein [Candidatus Rokubacteria bacterium]
MKAKIGAATVEVQKGDISTMEVDAVVNAANTELVMGTGVAGALKKRGGVVIEEEATLQAPVEVGEAILTTAGNLKATHVIHAAVMGMDLKTDPAIITKATQAVLALAVKHKLSTLALPALGSGVGHVPPAQSAEAMMEAVAAHLKTGPTSLKRVIFVLYQDDAHRAFVDTLKRVAGVQ